MTIIGRIKKKLYFVVAGYFRFFSKRALRRWNPRVIAITGSVGKTTMLNMMEYQLGDRAHYSHDANSAFGIAFDLVGLRGITGSKLRWLYLFVAVPIKSIFYKHTEEFYVVEIDGERPHETEFLASWLRPEVTVWVALGRSHAVQFEDQVKDGTFEDIDRAITHEFAMLPQYTTNLIMIDKDVPLMKKAVEKVKEHHDVKAKTEECTKADIAKYEVYPEYSNFTIGKSKIHFDNPQPRDISIQLVMLKKLMKYLNLEMKNDFSGLKFPPSRSNYFEGKKGINLIDSSYNAHLISVASILEMAREMHCDHKWLVIGDIVDQGSIEDCEHQKLADLIAEVKAEKVILIGRRTQKYTAPRLKELGIEAYSTLDQHEALEYIEANTTGKETLFFKGSQYLEWIIEKLLKNPEDAKKLCRREKAAVARRKKRGLDS